MITRRVGRTGRVRWQVRYYAPDGRERAKTFDRKVDAVAYEQEIATHKRRGDWVDPRRGTVILAVVWDEYDRSGSTHLRVTTRRTIDEVGSMLTSNSVSGPFQRSSMLTSQTG